MKNLPQIITMCEQREDYAANMGDMRGAGVWLQRRLEAMQVAALEKIAEKLDTLILALRDSEEARS